MPPQLTEQHKLFINALLDPDQAAGNATKAAISAGYAQASAHVRGSELRKHPLVAAEIARRGAKSEKKIELTVERIEQELAALALVDPGLLYDTDGKLLPINQIPEAARRAISSVTDKGVKLHSKLGALELAAKIRNMVKQEQNSQAAVQIIIGQPPELPAVTLEQRQLLPEWE